MCGSTSAQKTKPFRPAERIVLQIKSQTETTKQQQQHTAGQQWLRLRISFTNYNHLIYVFGNFSNAHIIFSFCISVGCICCFALANFQCFFSRICLHSADFVFFLHMHALFYMRFYCCVSYLHRFWLSWTLFLAHTPLVCALFHSSLLSCHTTVTSTVEHSKFSSHCSHRVVRCLFISRRGLKFSGKKTSSFAFPLCVMHNLIIHQVNKT